MSTTGHFTSTTVNCIPEIHCSCLHIFFSTPHYREVMWYPTGAVECGSAACSAIECAVQCECECKCKPECESKCKCESECKSKCKSE